MSLWLLSAVLTSATDPETWPSFNPPPVALQSPSLLSLPWFLLPSSCLPSFAFLCFILFYASPSFFLLPNPFYETLLTLSLSACPILSPFPRPSSPPSSHFVLIFLFEVTLFPPLFLLHSIPRLVSPFSLFSLCYYFPLSFLHPHVSSVVLLFCLLIFNPHPSNPLSFCTLPLLPPIPSHVSDRSCSFNRGCDSHSVHGSYLLRADRPDLPHPAYDGGSNPGQHGGPGPAALALRLHYPSQEAAVPAGAWLRTHEVCDVSKEVLLCCWKLISRNFPRCFSVETLCMKCVYKLCLSTSASVRLSYSQYNIFVEDIMVRKVKFISSQSTYREVKLLLDSSSLKSIPLVDSRGKRLNADFNLNSCLKLNESRLWSSCQHLYTKLHRILILACVVV